MNSSKNDAYDVACRLFLSIGSFKSEYEFILCL